MSTEFVTSIVPHDRNKITGICHNQTWIYGVVSRTVEFNGDSVTFIANWSGVDKRFTIALDAITAYAESL